MYIIKCRVEVTFKSFAFNLAKHFDEHYLRDTFSVNFTVTHLELEKNPKILSILMLMAHSFIVIHRYFLFTPVNLYQIMYFISYIVEIGLLNFKANCTTTAFKQSKSYLDCYCFIYVNNVDFKHFYYYFLMNMVRISLINNFELIINCLYYLTLLIIYTIINFRMIIIMPINTAIIMSFVTIIIMTITKIVKENVTSAMLIALNFSFIMNNFINFGLNFTSSAIIKDNLYFILVLLISSNYFSIIHLN